MSIRDAVVEDLGEVGGGGGAIGSSQGKQETLCIDIKMHLFL